MEETYSNTIEEMQRKHRKFTFWQGLKLTSSHQILYSILYKYFLVYNNFIFYIIHFLLLYLLHNVIQ